MTRTEKRRKIRAKTKELMNDISKIDPNLPRKTRKKLAYEMAKTDFED